MSYIPPSQQPGGASPEGGAETTPIMGGGSTPPSDQGGYTPPPPQTGDYTPPPAGSYTPPPPPPGYGTPPPGGGGYGPTPPGGGYGYGGGAPPPPTPPPTAPPAGPSNMGHLIQSYINAVTRPNVATYEAEIPNASLVKVLIGIVVVAVVGLLTGFIGAGAATAQINQAIDQMRGQAGTETTIQFLQSIRDSLVTVGPISGFVGPFITFFLGAIVQYVAAKIFGGQDSTENGFMTHAYLASLSYTPIKIVISVLNLVPGVGACLGFLLTLYQIYSVGISLQASQRMQAGRAQLAAWITLVLCIVLICVCVILGTLLAIGGTRR